MGNRGNLTAMKTIMALSLILMLAANMLANLLPIAGVTSGAVSDAYPNLFAPAPPTFFIWFLIYVWLILYILYILGAFGAGNPEMVRATGIPFILSCACNAAWIFAWHFQVIWLSTGLIAGLLLSLAVLYVRIREVSPGRRERWFVQMPFSIYFGWLTVAAVGNVVTLLVSLQWNGSGVQGSAWMIITAAAAAALGIAVTLMNADAFFGLVFVWAYAGILYRHLSPGGFDGQYPGVIIAVTAALVLTAASAAVAAVRDRRARLGERA